MVRTGIFLTVSAAILWISRKPLGDPRSHGFPRFFAFEFLLALILRNAPGWFRDPLAPRQLISWLLLLVSMGLAAEGFRLLRSAGKPAGAEGTRLAFENTTRLVVQGIYRYIRHPMYSSLLALVWGVFLKRPDSVSLMLSLAASGFLVATALAEERENLLRFGESYARYQRHTRRFIPFVL